MLVRKRVFVLLVVLLVVLLPLCCKRSLEDWILGSLQQTWSEVYLQLQFVDCLPFNFKHTFVAALQTLEFPEVHSMMTVLIYN